MGAGAASHGPAPAPYRRLIRLLRPDRADIGVMLVLSISNGILLLATPLAVDSLVNNIAFGGQEGAYVQALLILSITLLAFLTLLAVMRGAQHYVMEIIQRRLFVRVTADLAFRLPHTRLPALERTMGPELVNRFFEVVTVQKSSSMLLLEGVNLALSTFIGLLVLGFYHPFLLAFDLVLVAALAFVMVGMGRNAVRTSISESYAKHAVAGWLEQVALAPVLFKSQGAADLACQRADALARDYLNARRSHFRILLGQIIGLLALQAIASSALLTIGGVLVLRGELTLGQLVASELIVGAIVASVAKFGKYLGAWYDALAAVDKLGTLTDLPLERETGEPPDPAPGPMEVRAEQISFTYDPARPVMRDVSFHFPAGAKVAVVSAAGSGASTLLDLLYGLRQASEGFLLVDGVDLRHWPPAALRRHVALVRGQEIVEGSIAENVRLARTDVTLGDVRAALDCVGLTQAVLDLPDGLDSRLSFGGRPLSSSQRLRLVVARAIAGKPRLLLLDESLDGLDVETVAEVERYLFDQVNPWTLVLVTRDPDLVRRCDQVVQLGECHPSTLRNLDAPPV
ncbi:MAG: ATP-binding cassette domain-containing protein [Deltaproteobacteria bacterium]|nr:ATP-binding cassette domain-containing protein [Deltaproteobacteria bacterium]